MKIEYMQELIELAKDLNFTATANRLFVSQSSLSRHVAAVEQEMGCLLFTRDKMKANITLTKEGEIVLEGFRKILNDYNALSASVSISPDKFRGHLSVGILYYAILEYAAPMMQHMSRNFENINIDYQSYQPHPLTEDLSNRKIDLGIIMHRYHPIDDIIRIEKIASESLCCMMSESHPLAKKSSISLADLAACRLVFSKSDPELTNDVSTLLSIHQVNNEDKTYSAQVDTLPLTVIQENGIAIIPAHIRNTSTKMVTFRPIEEEDFYLNAYWAYHTMNTNPAIPLFLNQWQALRGSTPSRITFD